MKTKNLKEAIEEAKRFIQRAEDLQAADPSPRTHGSFYGYPTEQGAVKRASMDLTRALSKLRNDKD